MPSQGVSEGSTGARSSIQYRYTLSEAWNGVNWADLIAAQGAFGTDFYDRSILSLKLVLS